MEFQVQFLAYVIFCFLPFCLVLSKFPSTLNVDSTHCMPCPPTLDKRQNKLEGFNELERTAPARPAKLMMKLLMSVSPLALLAGSFPPSFAMSSSSPLLINHPRHQEPAVGCSFYITQLYGI